ncbi:MAG: NAD(P)/FAD-dependent oxidoreductase, partial [Candidatus Aminicenantes bacterium]
MNVSHTHDVLIVGAGPAGSTLGYLLAERGFDILVIDRAYFPRPKLCGGVVTWKTRKICEEVFKAPFMKLFAVESFSEDYVIYEKYKQKVFQSSPEPFYFVDREKYDTALVSLAREKGCQFQFGIQVTEGDFQSGVVHTRSREHSQEIKKPGERKKHKETDKPEDTRDPTEMEEFNSEDGFENRDNALERNRFVGKIIVGADGVNSVVRARLFPDMDFHRNSGLAFQIKIPVDKIKPKYRKPPPQLYLGGVRCGYGWIFPHGELCVVGLWGLIGKDKRIKERFLDFLRRVTEMDVENLSHIPAHLGPAGNFVGSPGEGNAVLVGDAAGFADSLTGEGIYYAHKSAECAANAIFDYFESGGKSELLESYKSYLTPIFRELKISLRLRNLVYSNLRKIGFFILRNPRVYYALAAVVHGSKSY